MASRRSVLIGLGSLVAGGGALLGTGAFTTVTAERTVTVETTGDASGFLGLEAADRSDDTGSGPGNTSEGVNENEYVTVESDGTIQINLAGNDDGAEGLNRDATTTFRNLVTVTNNGTQDVNTLTLSMSLSGGSSLSSNPFSFTAEGNTRATVDDGVDLLGGDGLDRSLEPGESIDFGMVIDLIDGSLPDGETDLTLTITAQTADSQ